MSDYGLKVISGGIELLDTNRMGCVFRLYGDSHNVPHGRFSQVDFPLPAPTAVNAIFGDYSMTSVVSAFNDGYGNIWRGPRGGGSYGLYGAQAERYLNLIRSAVVNQKLVSEGRHILSSSHPLVGCSNNINGASNYESIASGLPTSAYGIFGKNNLLHLATSVNSYKLISIEGYSTAQINTYRASADPDSLDFNDLGNRKNEMRGRMRRAMGIARDVSVISIPCGQNEVLAIQCRTVGVSVALYHKSPYYEIYVCVGAPVAELRVYRYTNDSSDTRIPEWFNSKYGVAINGSVSKFDSRQPLMIPIWVSYSGEELNSIVSSYKTAIVFSNIRNFVTEGQNDATQKCAESTVVLPAVVWLDEYRVNYNFVSLIGSESDVHSFYVEHGGSFVGMFSDASYVHRMLNEAAGLFNRLDETRVMDPTYARNRTLYYNNWNNINGMGGCMGVIAY